jgi:hypothetical protein
MEAAFARNAGGCWERAQAALGAVTAAYDGAPNSLGRRIRL